MVEKINPQKPDKFSLEEVQNQPKGEDFSKVLGVTASKADDAYKLAFQATERSMFQALMAQFQTFAKQKASDANN